MKQFPDSPAPRRLPRHQRAGPPISVVMPVLNEERHLREAVRQVLAQDYAGPIEVVLALGPSSDRTDEVAAELAAEDPRVRTVRQPDRPHARRAQRRASRAARHDIIVRVDGHAMLPPDYLRAPWRRSSETGADNVGGIMAAEGVTPFEQAVAARDDLQARRRRRRASTPAAARAGATPSTSASSAARRSSGSAATTSTSCAPRTGR